jgi:serine/threonine-protein kinase
VTEPLPRLAAALADRYRIERELGAGGMATVYLAHDIRHDRKVAMKVLRPELAAVIGAERFLREIKTIAHLQHPHILGLIDSGEVDGTAFYVMPFVEGESLRDRLNRERQLPIGDAIRLAVEVAGALDYAHRHGVIHRDIKPENVMLHDGSALVTDFGIALAISTAGNTRMTETGMSLGTPHYMSPEQAMGEREITARSDVYALGATLYEMLVGEPPFTGPTAQSIVAKVLTEEPRPLHPKRHTIPANVEAATLHALEKLPADRFATAAEVAAALTDSAYRGPGPATRVVEAGARAGRPRSRFLLIGAGLLAGMLLGAGGYALLHQQPTPPVTRYAFTPPPEQAPLPGFAPIPSPDGSLIAYVGPGGPRSQIWVKRRDRYAGTPLSGTAGSTTFTWSPDGQWIAFVLARGLYKVPAVGGAPILLADSISGNPGIAWLDDGTIVALRVNASGLLRVSQDGGPVSRVFSETATVLFPSALPHARGVLFTRCGVSCTQQHDVWALDLKSNRATEVVRGAVWAQYVSTGHLLYIRDDGGMLAVPFDLGKLETRGSAIPVEDSIAVLNSRYPVLGLSTGGTLVLQTGAPLALLRRYDLVWVDRGGRETPVDSGWTLRMTDFGDNYGWSLSGDGSRLAIGLATNEGDDIWLKRLPRGPLSRVSFDPAAEYRPRWLADGRTILFSSNRTEGGGAGGLYTRRADATGSDSLLLRAAAGVFEGQFSPDGQWLIYRTGGTVGQTGGRDIVGRRVGAGDTATVRVVVSPYDEEAFGLSPDGNWLAYESNETGQTEIFVRPFPNTEGGKWQVSNGGGVAPLWSKNGRELFYVNGDRDMMAVPVGAGAEPRLGERQRLFHMRSELYLAPNEYYTPYDVAPDGRFIMARQIPLAPGSEVPLIVVENWLKEFRKAVGK